MDGNRKNWVDVWKNKELKIDLELSTFCNIKCPQCPRHQSVAQYGIGNVGKLELTQGLTQETWSLDKFKKSFPPEALDHITNMSLSGTFGDPLMCKDIIDILSYIMDNSKMTISISTNGSMRNEIDYYQMGMICAERLTMIFAVDGIDNEMHQRYRRGSDLDKVLRNMEAISETPAKVKGFTVIFKHNQDYLDQIRELCEKHGATMYETCESNRFSKSNTFSFLNEDGDTETLEMLTKDEKKRDHWHVTRRVRNYHDIHKAYDSNNIKCVTLDQNRLYVSQIGNVSPCCHLNTPLTYRTEFNRKRSGRNDGTPIFEQMVETHKNRNLNYSSLKDIIADIWWEDLIKSWEDTPAFACKNICGDCNEKSNI